MEKPTLPLRICQDLFPLFTQHLDRAFDVASLSIALKMPVDGALKSKLGLEQAETFVHDFHEVRVKIWRRPQCRLGRCCVCCEETATTEQCSANYHLHTRAILAAINSMKRHNLEYTNVIRFLWPDTTIHTFCFRVIEGVENPFLYTTREKLHDLVMIADTILQHPTFEFAPFIDSCDIPNGLLTYAHTNDHHSYCLHPPTKIAWPKKTKWHLPDVFQWAEYMQETRISRIGPGYHRYIGWKYLHTMAWPLDELLRPVPMQIDMLNKLHHQLGVYVRNSLRLPGCYNNKKHAMVRRLKITQSQRVRQMKFFDIDRSHFNQLANTSIDWAQLNHTEADRHDFCFHRLPHACPTCCDVSKSRELFLAHDTTAEDTRSSQYGPF